MYIYKYLAFVYLQETNTRIYLYFLVKVMSHTSNFAYCLLHNHTECGMLLLHFGVVQIYTTPIFLSPLSSFKCIYAILILYNTHVIKYLL